MKLIRALIAAAVALIAAVALQMAGSSGASATTNPVMHTNDCGTCWQIVNE